MLLKKQTTDYQQGKCLLPLYVSLMAKQVKIPKEINPDPIIDSVVEFRFNVNIPKESVFGKIFSQISEELPNYKASDIPNQVRKSFGKNFQYAVEGTLDNGEFSVGIGQQVLVFNCINGYKKWDNYFPIIKKYLGIVLNLGIINQIVRIGIRYINFFEEISDVSKNLTLNISFEGQEEYTTHNTMFRSKLSKSEFTHNLNITDDATYKNLKGSLLDIDTYFENFNSIDLDYLLKIVEQGHIEEKCLFYYLLRKEFLEKLNPVYK